MAIKRRREGHQSEDSIKVFKGLDAVRKKPGMYIGPVDSHGIFTILREAMDNSVDEFLANSDNDRMEVQVYKDGYLAVHDNGQGIPVGKHKTEKVSTLEVATGMLHAGGKLEESAYKHSRGTHGVGVAVTNALSEHFLVFTHRGGSWHGAEYRRGKLTKRTAKLSRAQLEKHIEPAFKQGTIILFKPDMSIFRKGSKLSPKLVVDWAKTTAYLSGGFGVTIDVEDDEREFFLFENGILDWLEDSVTELDCATLMKKPIQITSQHLDLCVAITDAEGCRLDGYCNGLLQVDGGNHVNTVLSALYASLKPYAGAKDSFTRDDVAEGLLGIVNFKVDSPEFSSQTKEKLVDRRFDDLCKADITDGLAKYWSSNKSLAKDVVRRAVTLRSAKMDFSLQKKALRDLKKRRGDTTRLPTKLASVPDCKDEERELFLVEGESAGGTTRVARLTEPYRFQETLCLKGKIPNAFKTKIDKMLGNDEVLNILTAIGYDPDRKDPLDKLRVGKIVLLSDPDFDGYHIDSLLLALMVTFLPGLFERGMVYRSISPRYILAHGGRQYFGMTLEELRENAPKSANMNKATYLKGWGEAEANAMRDIAFNPHTRRLEEAEAPSRKDMRNIALLMGDDPSYRKEMLGV